MGNKQKIYDYSDNSRKSAFFKTRPCIQKDFAKIDEKMWDAEL